MCPAAPVVVALATAHDVQQMIGAIYLYTHTAQLSFEDFAQMISKPDDRTSLQAAIEEIADFIRYKSEDTIGRDTVLPPLEQEAVEKITRFAYRKLDRF